MDEELVQLPWEYASPQGVLLIASFDGEPAGCIALRPLTDLQHCAEMRRLYVRPTFRGSGIGRLLVDRLLADAHTIGYERIVLTTLPSMKRAQAIYQEVGFNYVAPYVLKPTDGVLYMSLNLIPVQAPTSGKDNKQTVD
jgi:ribosomal protein S18 acetylase RimI-like enzyme